MQCSLVPYSQLCSEKSYVNMMHESVGIQDICLSTPSEGDDYQGDVACFQNEEMGKGRDFLMAEDTSLVMAWKSVNIDLVVGSDQNTNNYWKCIADHFNCIAPVSID